MAQRKAAGATGEQATAAEGSGDVASSARGSRKAPRVIKAGGHVITADPLPPTPEPDVRCGACGQQVVDGRCPNGHGADKPGGWGVEDEG